MELTIVQEKRELEEQEEIIRKNLTAFYEVGRALAFIRDDKLYQVKGYETFEAYCKGEWDISKMHAYRLMDSCKVIDTIKSNQLVTPATESQTRPLARLKPEQQCEAWQKAVETAPDGKVTAAHVYKIVKDMTATEQPAGADEGESREGSGEDSDILFQLKMWWRKATKKDRKAFLAWIKTIELGRA